MTHYSAPLKDYTYLLHDVVGAAQLAQTAALEESTLDIFHAVLTEAAKFAENTLAPLNRSGDEEGCSIDAGIVSTPKGFPEAYDGFQQGGWAGLTARPEDGGQGLAHTLYLLVDEIFTTANAGFAMYRGLIDGAYNTILKHGNKELQTRYLPLLASGEVLPTMNLTEPHCGSDLGLLRTKAEPMGNGSYSINGTKIFITGGEHDLTRNILHLVLARLPDAPEGSRGISLFLVPKYYDDPDTNAELRNNVICSGIEHKMGLKSSATCVMNYDDAKGWLVGAPHTGLRAMFTLMNAARLGVGLQGVCAAEGAYQIASAYAAERCQGKAPDVEGTGPDRIDMHPDVKRMLMMQKVFAQGGRALAVRMAMELDLCQAAAAAGDTAASERHNDMAQLLTPIVKSFLTDVGCESANLAVQTMGGHGYIREWGVEQWVRDIRIATIYEGTNGIQALDLVERKLRIKGGSLADNYLSELKSEFRLATSLFPLAADGLKALETLVHCTTEVSSASAAKRADAASDFLSLFGLVALAGEWARMARVSARIWKEAPAFHEEKIEAASFYFQRILPRYLGTSEIIRRTLEQK